MVGIKIKLQFMKDNKNYVKLRISDNSIKSIFHLADLHIPNDNGEFDSRIPEYRRVFNTCLEDFTRDAKGFLPPDIIIFIGGDIFDAAKKDNGCVSANAQDLFKNFIKRLQKIGTVIIIPGNHDNNITYKSTNTKTKDVISSILSDINGENETLFYLKNTGSYLIDNCHFYTASVFDLDKIKGPRYHKTRLKILPQKHITSKVDHHILLLHCGIQGQIIHNGHMLHGYEFTVSDIEHFDIVLLGDTHKHQFLGSKKNIAYPSSLIQQNYGEDIKNHGYISWDLTNTSNKYKGTFHDIHNDDGLIELNLIAHNVEFLLEQLGKYKKKRNLKVQIRYSQETPLEVIQLLKNNIGRTMSHINFIYREKMDYINKKQIAVEDKINNQIEFRNYLETTEIPKEYYDFINEQVKPLFNDDNKGGNHWHLIGLELHNFLTTMGTQNINFDDISDNKVISIGGNCAVGKSNVLRALIYVIWGLKAVDVTKLESLINHNAKRMHVIFKFKYNNQLHQISRELKAGGRQTKEELNYFIDKEPQKCGHKLETEKLIKKVFHEFDDAKMTWILRQNAGVPILKSTVFDRNIGIGGWVEKKDIVAKKLKNTKKEISKKRKYITEIQEFPTTVPKLNDICKNIDSELSELKRQKEEALLCKHLGTKQDRMEWEKQQAKLEKELHDLKLNALITISKKDYEGLLGNRAKILLILENNKIKKNQLVELQNKLDALDIPKYNEQKLRDECQKLETDIKKDNEELVRCSTIIDGIQFNKEDYENKEHKKITLDKTRINLINKRKVLECDKVKKAAGIIELGESEQSVLNKYALLTSEKMKLIKIVSELEQSKSVQKALKNNLEKFEKCLCTISGKWTNTNNFNDCDCCKGNKSKYDIDTDVKELNKCHVTIKNLSENKDNCERIIGNLHKYIQKNSDIKTNKSIRQDIVCIDNKIKTLTLQIENTTEKLNNIVKELRVLVHNKEKIDNNKREVIEIKKKTNKIIKTFDLTKINLKMCDTYNKKYKEVSDAIERNKTDLGDVNETELTTKLEDCRQKIDDYKKYNKFIELKDKTEVLIEKIEKCKNYDPELISKHTATIHKLTIQRDEINRNLSYAIHMTNEHNKCLEEESKLKRFYSNLMHLVTVLDGWPKQLRQNATIKMTKAVNKYIEFSGFDYKAIFEWDIDARQNKKCQISYKNVNGLPLAVISGAEKSVFRLALQNGLNTISNLNRSPILFIDEGFAGWDKLHLEGNLKGIFNFLKQYYKYTLSISHIECVQKCADIKWYIDKDGTIDTKML
uniref:Calcineurin-like phosphoesterase domain-containing protein n=1 Tax=viral metagenome TaxID=1070528 RepID=A0A6C0B4T3_9ZZZZ